MSRITLLALAASVTACSAILGLQEPTVDNTIGDGGGGEGGTCGDTTNNPANCGACGHDCLGGTCVASVCQPVLVISNSALLAPYDMLVGDDGFSYFTDGSSDTGAKNVARVDKTMVNGTTPELLIDWTANEGYPNQLAIGGGNFYFAVDSQVANPYYGGGIVMCPLAGCPNGQGVSTGGISSYAVATDGTHVFFGADYADGNFNDFYQLHITDMGLKNNSELINGLAGSDYNYIDTDREGGIYYGTGDGLFKCNAAGCGDAGAPLLGAQQLEINEVRYAGDRIYFTSAPFSSGASVQWVPTAGGTPTFVTTNVNFPLGIVTDANYVYFTDVGNLNNPSDGRVTRCPRDGCGGNDVNAVKLSNGAANGGNPRALAQDTTMLYWGTYTGNIWRVAK